MRGLMYTVLLAFHVTSEYVVRDQSVEPDYSNIEYGGIWKTVISTTSNEDKDIVGVVQCALLYLKKCFLSRGVKNESLYSYKVGGITKLKLIYTRDDRKPFHRMIWDSNGEKQILKSSSDPVEFGMTYFFYLEWHHKSNTERHRFTVTMYPAWKYHIYSHTAKDPRLFSHQNLLQNISKSHLKNVTPSYARVSLDSDGSSCNSFYTRSFTPTQVEVGRDTFPKREMFSSGERSEDDNKYCKTLPSKLSVMSYNIWNFFSIPKPDNDLLYQARIKHLTKVVLKHQPDIVVFQEVRFDIQRQGGLGPSQVDHLSAMLPGYQFVYHPAQVFETSLKNGRVEEGLAIFSRHPIVIQEFLLLFRNQSNSADLHQRLCQHVEVRIPGVKQQVHIFNTHLSLSHEAREESVTQIWNYIQQFKGAAILAGDFNSEPQEKSIQIINENTSLTDVWTYIHGNKAPGFTFSTLKEQLDKRIDYIFVRRQAGVEILDVAVIDDGKRREEAASDHVALMATIGMF